MNPDPITVPEEEYRWRETPLERGYLKGLAVGFERGRRAEAIRQTPQASRRSLYLAIGSGFLLGLGLGLVVRR